MVRMAGDISKKLISLFGTPRASTICFVTKPEYERCDLYLFNWNPRAADNAGNQNQTF